MLSLAEPGSEFTSFWHPSGTIVPIAPNLPAPGPFARKYRPGRIIYRFGAVN
jgi:hypothetical protein